MENLKLSVELPVFSGFYNSIWDGESDQESELDDINSQRECKGLLPITWDMMEFNYTEFKNETSRKVTSVMEDWLIELGITEALKFDELVSPKFYNYSTDRIFAFAEISEKNIYCIKGYLLLYRDEFAEYLEARHKSYDGFISFYDYRIEAWDEKLEDFSELDNIELCSIFGFILANENSELEDSYNDIALYYAVEDNYLSCSNYEELLTIELCSCGEALKLSVFYEEYKTEVINQVAMFETVRLVKTFDTWCENNAVQCPSCDISYKVSWDEVYKFQSLSDDDE